MNENVEVAKTDVIQSDTARSHEQTNLGGYGGGILPPSADDYKRMWEMKSKEMKEHEFRKQAEANRKQAIREVFQDNVKQLVSVKDKKLEENFFNAIDIEERR